MFKAVVKGINGGHHLCQKWFQTADYGILRKLHETSLGYFDTGESVKKIFVKKTLLLFLSASIVLSGCAKEEPPAKPEVTPDKRVFVSGSAAVMPLLQKMAAAFALKEPDIEVVFLPASHSKGGVAGTVEEKYDIGAVSRELSPDERAKSLQYLHFAVDGLVFVTNRSVSIRNLTTEQIRAIFAGTTTNWSQLGGPDAKIAVIDRPEHTSAKISLRRTFLVGMHVTNEAVVVERPWQVTDSVQLIPNSIGYTSLGEIISNDPPVNIISVNGVEPIPANVQTGQYKFFRTLGLVIGPQPKIGTMRFLNFIFSETGSRILRNSGYIPQKYEVQIGIVPEQSMMIQEQRYRPLAEYLSHKLGEKFSVRLRLFPTYIEVCRALARGDINAAFLGSLAYATVREHVDVIARPDYGGVSTYRGMLFVRSDSAIDSFDKMRGARLVMGGKTTTAGYVFPLYYFKEHGINDYEHYFSKAYFVGTHEDAILAVLHGQADVGAAKDLIFDMIAKDHPALESSIRILAESPPVPSNAFVLRKDLSMPCFDCHQRQAQKIGAKPLEQDVNMTAAIKRDLLAMTEDPEGQKALEAIGNATRFIETTDADYSALYTMLEAIQVHPEELLDQD